MTSRQNIIVRRTNAADTHAESVVCDYPLSRHLHWPRRLGAEELDWQLLSEVGGQPAGRTGIEAVYPPFGELINLHVQPALRGRGVGGALVDECVESLGRLGFMAVFLQTDDDLTAGHRLYARKGFVLAAKGRMLRLVRFINLPILDSFLFDHPLAAYQTGPGPAPKQWRMAWIDWPTGDTLQLTLTGGTSDKDSDDIGPGLGAVAMRSGSTQFSASLNGPAEATVGGTAELAFKFVNEGDDPLPIVVRLLLPPHFTPQGEWSKKGPKVQLDSGADLDTVFELSVDRDLDPDPLRYCSFASLPLTVEVFVGETSFWLTQSLKVTCD